MLSTVGASAGLSVYQFTPSALTSTRVASGLLPPIAPEVMPPPEKLLLVTAKKVLPKMRRSWPKGLDGSLMIGWSKRTVSEPLVPTEMSCDLENGGLNGWMEAPEAGAPSTAEVLVNPAAKPVPLV